MSRTFSTPWGTRAAWVDGGPLRCGLMVAPVLCEPRGLHHAPSNLLFSPLSSSGTSLSRSPLPSEAGTALGLTMNTSTPISMPSQVGGPPPRASEHLCVPGTTRLCASHWSLSPFKGSAPRRAQASPFLRVAAARSDGPDPQHVLKLMMKNSVWVSQA